MSNVQLKKELNIEFKLWIDLHLGEQNNVQQTVFMELSSVTTEKTESRCSEMQHVYEPQKIS